ncbi:recombinase family protein [Herbiconiux sp. CPCC 205763]|uniref:Recombinase family protein n=1 Tax=Herbiconiux aconitum TaxID=2970913 RepID=A0ABT2GQW4_9MICO|nr:recombinase family protein [Herbiconiux aconitum]MCS5718604.1 recombinase family protein [Herbiconiux aconitum]
MTHSRLRAAIYLRISQDATGEGLAVERQRADCVHIAQSRGWEVVGEYSDTVSASNRRKKRPEYDRMVEDYERGRFDALVCWDLDRLTRQPRQLEDWIDRSEERGLVILTANGEADLGTDNGRLFARVKASVARSEVERKSARQRRANEQRIETGRPTPGRRRYGYEIDGVTLREAEAIVVRRMYEHVADGGSLRSLASALTAEGVDPAPGASWTPRRVRYILDSPVYAGNIVRRGETLPSAFVQPIVEPALSEAVRALLADPSRRTSPGPTPRHLLSGIAVCGDCGGPLTYRRGYLCTANLTHPFIKKDLLEDLVREAVARAFITSSAELFPRTAGGREIVDLVAAHERNVETVEVIIADRDEGLVPAPLARRRLLELRDERVTLEEQLERARTSKSAGAVLLGAVHDIIDDLPGAGADYADLEAEVLARFDQLDLDRQRDLVRALLDVQVDHGRNARRRVRVWHRLATHLNPDVILAEAD